LPFHLRQRLKVYIPRLIGTADYDNFTARYRYLGRQAITVYAPLATEFTRLILPEAPRLESGGGTAACRDLLPAYSKIFPKTAEALDNAYFAAAATIPTTSGLLHSEGPVLHDGRDRPDRQCRDRLSKAAPVGSLPNPGSSHVRDA